MREFVKYLMLLIVGIVPVSCVFDADRCIMSTDEPHDIMFTVSVEGRHTRATWEEEYPSETGVPFDYRILPDRLRMVILAEDGTHIGEIRDLDYWPINETHTAFQFVGQLPTEAIEYINAHTDNPNYRFMVLANCGDNLSGEQYITYSLTQLNPANNASAIPMWGVKKADVSPLYEQDNLNLGDIWLLRAAAKVEVKLSDALKAKGTTTITAATLKYYNQTGYVLPSGWSGVSDTRNLDQENCLRVYRHAAVNLPFVKDEATGSYYVYVTEYDNINYSGERNKISLEFNVGGTTKIFEDAISFCEYRGGALVENSHYSIVRNHIYEFEILSIAGSSLVLEYTVADWTKEDWGNGEEYKEHDLSYPTYHNPVVPLEFLNLNANAQANYILTKEPTMQYHAGNLEQDGFHCYFQIVEPAGVKWMPVFMGTKENYKISVYKYDRTLQKYSDLKYDTEGNGSLDSLDVCMPHEWYHIVVSPKSDDGAGTTEVDFGITYYQEWTDQYINLYVNGEYGNIRWPNSGDNPKLIKIKHVSASQVTDEND